MASSDPERFAGVKRIFTRQVRAKRVAGEPIWRRKTALRALRQRIAPGAPRFAASPGLRRGAGAPCLAPRPARHCHLP
jgi:hypothetical protein